MSCELEGGGRRSISPTKLVAMATSLEGSKKITSDRSSTAKVLPILQITCGDRSGRC